MSQIGNLIASSSSVFNLDFLPERLLIGAVDTDVPLSQISVVSGGVQLMSVTDAGRIRALAKFDEGGMLGADIKVAMWLRLAVGRVQRQTTINLTNSGAGTEAVQAVSTGMGEIGRTAVEQTINASANGTFENFEALFFSPTNVLRVQLLFANGFADEYTVGEIDAMYAAYHISDADGRLNGLSCIDAETMAGEIVQATIYNGSGGSTTVLRTGYQEL
jgi:hypothetical protein